MSTVQLQSDVWGSIRLHVVNEHVPNEHFVIEMLGLQSAWVQSGFAQNPFEHERCVHSKLLPIGEAEPPRICKFSSWESSSAVKSSSFIFLMDLKFIYVDSLEFFYTAHLQKPSQRFRKLHLQHCNCTLLNEIGDFWDIAPYTKAISCKRDTSRFRSHFHNFFLQNRPSI